MTLLRISLVTLTIVCYCPYLQAQLNRPATDRLIKRILPKHANSFIVETIQKRNEKDVFEIESKNGKIILRGNNGVSIASAFNYYLKNYAHCDIGWNGTNLYIPEVLPVVPEKVRLTSPYRKRFYLNYCTFNYTMSWWDWQRWEREIDWMALNGINMPLALTGQDLIWRNVYRKLGFSDKDMNGFFSGPAYLSWFWMGNLDAWGGPLPESWMVSHEVLQKKILERERELGMTPVLPAFTGHVPPAFKKRFPDVRLKATQWVNFPAVNILDPSEPMFTKIGSMFIEEQAKTYGTDHLYSADTFNENVPPTSDSMYLNDMSKKVYESMSTADPEAIWVMQAWMFSHNDSYWKPTQVKALLNAVPDSKMVVLDLFSESYPVWNKTEAYYGKPWIWNMLHNFGGNIGMFGRMDVIANGPAGMLNNPDAGNMIGVGVTAEGIEENPVMYELMLDNVWRDKPVELKAWLKDYAKRRYGSENSDAAAAWQILWKTAYSGGLTSGTPKSIISARPTLNRNTRQVNPQKRYADKDFFLAWHKLITASTELKKSDGFQYDLVDVTRQALANYADLLQQEFAADFKNKDISAFKRHSGAFLDLMEDMDRLLATRKDFLLGAWVNAARRWAANPTEANLFEKNARNLITLWGDTTCRLNDYSARQWNGMIKGFYQPRWQQFISLASIALEEDQPLDLNEFESTIRKWEWAWVNSHELYRDRPEGDPITTAIEMYNKYGNDIIAAF